MQLWKNPIQPYSILTLVFSLSSALTAFAQPAVPIKWAAIGNSITEGSGYPAKLQTLLGPAYKVENEGVSATTLLKKSNYSYWTNGKLPQTFTFKPDIVSIKLGTNDSKPVNWPTGKTAFAADARALIDTLGTISTKPRIFPCYPVPVFQKNGAWSVDGINDPVIKNEIMPLIKQVADEKKLDVIDLHTFLESRGDLFANDGVHPDAGKAGADSIAAMIFRTYKSKVTRIACVGNSITDNNHDANAYPVRFNQLLGRDYYVLNAGHSGRTLLRKGDQPYNKSNWFGEVFKFQPHIITIKLGTNDSKPYNWDANKNDFVTDLNWLIDTLGTIPTKPRIILCTPIPAWQNTNGTFPFDIRPAVILDEIIPKIKQVATARGLGLIDLHTPFLPYQKLTSDNIHPTPAGSDTLAHMVFRAFKELDKPVAARPVAFQNQSKPATLRANRLTPAWLNALLGRRISE
jgi:acyl-CoA thioesterase I